MSHQDDQSYRPEDDGGQLRPRPVRRARPGAPIVIWEQHEPRRRSPEDIQRQRDHAAANLTKNQVAVLNALTSEPQGGIALARATGLARKTCVSAVMALVAKGYAERGLGGGWIA